MNRILAKTINNWSLTISGKLIPWIEQLGFWGAFRFKLIRLLYKLDPWYPITRNEKWDFILQYLPPLTYMYYINKLKVLEIGCNDSLLIYEVVHRCYKTYGMDIRDFQEKLPKHITFFRQNILSGNLDVVLPGAPYHYIVATSVIELVGTGAYDQPIIENGDRIAIEHIYNLLRDDGYLILTLPTPFWKSRVSRGYDLRDFHKLIDGLFNVYELTQRGGALCVVLVKNIALIKEK